MTTNPTNHSNPFWTLILLLGTWTFFLFLLTGCSPSESPSPQPSQSKNPSVPPSSSPKPSSHSSPPSQPKAKPDADFPSYSFSHNFQEPPLLSKAFYQVPQAEANRLRAKATKLARKKIDTSTMERWYAPFPRRYLHVPIFMGDTILTPKKPSRSTHWELFYQEGSLRSGILHQNQSQYLKLQVFYNDMGAPAVVFDNIGPTGNAFNLHLMEYDSNGYLSRIIQWGNLGKITYVTLYRCRNGYRDFDFYSFKPDGKLSSKLTYSDKKGSFVYKPKQDPKRIEGGAYRKIKALEKYGLSPVLPL